MIARSLWAGVVVVMLVACGGEDEATTAAAEPTATASTAAPTTMPAATMAPTTESPPTTVAPEPLEVGLDWIRVAYDDGVFEGAALSDVTAHGTGWVAVGVTGDEGALGVWASDDGVEWAIVEASTFVGDTAHLRTVDGIPQCAPRSYLRPDSSWPGPTVATDGELLVLGCWENIWTSTDGATWTRAVVETPDYYLPFDVPRTRAVTLKNLNVIDVARGPSGWVAVGWGQYGQDIASATHTATVWRSDDGLTWEVPATNKADFADTYYWYEAEVDAVVPFEGGWIAAGAVRLGVDEGNMTVWSSSDGGSYATLGDGQLGTVVEPSMQGILGLTADAPSGLVAVGWASDDPYMGETGGFGSAPGTAAAWLSSDGATWTRVESAAFVGDGYEVAADVTRGGPGLVAVGGGRADIERWGIVWTSTDGSAWSRVAPGRLDNLRPLTAVASGPSGLVAVGGPGVWVSGDFPRD